MVNPFLIRHLQRSAAAGTPPAPARTSTVRNIQDGTTYVLSGGRPLRGMWLVTVAAQRWLGMKRTAFRVCIITPELSFKIGDLSITLNVNMKNTTWKNTACVSVSSFKDEDFTALYEAVSHTVQTAPRSVWDSFVQGEIRRLTEILPENM